MNLRLRMYFFVPYNLSEIQKGIQAGHAALEYASLFGRTKLFKQFIEQDKTWIILNGGTTRDKHRALENGLEAGTLNQIARDLFDHDISYSIFREPDLNYALTAVCFIADERVWDFETYPDCEPLYNEASYNRCINETLGGKSNLFLRDLIRNKRLA